VLDTANVVISAPILFTVVMEAICSSETTVLERVTWRNIQEDGILLSAQAFFHYLDIKSTVSINSSA
jgi:hypothetical protein